MKLFELKFTLRNPFNELKHLFAIFNNMIINGNTCKVHLENDPIVNEDTLSNYLHIEIFRCKTTFPSIEINRLLNPEIEISREILYNIHKLNNMKNIYPYFSLDDNLTDITISVFNEIYEPVLIPALEIVTHKEDNDIFSLGFSLRRSFQELPDLISVSNQMFENGYNMYVSIEQSKKDLTASYLSFKVMFKTTWRPSLCINAGYSSYVNIKDKYRQAFSKWNYICSQYPKVCPIWFSILQVGTNQHGPLLQMHLSKPFKEDSLKKIEDKLNLIFPE